MIQSSKTSTAGERVIHKTGAAAGPVGTARAGGGALVSR